MKYSFKQIYAVFMTSFAMIYISAVTFCQVPVDGKRIADTVVGFLIGTALTTLISFFFGDSEKQSTEPPKV